VTSGKPVPSRFCVILKKWKIYRKRSVRLMQLFLQRVPAREAVLSENGPSTGTGHWATSSRRRRISPMTPCSSPKTYEGLPFGLPLMAKVTRLLNDGLEHYLNGQLREWIEEHGIDRTVLVRQCAAVNTRLDVRGEDLVEAVRHPRPHRIKVAFTVGNEGDHAGPGQHRPGRFGRLDPAARFLFAQRPVGVRRQFFVPACPHLPAYKTQAGTALGVERKHGMQQHAPSIAFLDLAKIAPIVRGRREFDLAGILQSQNMPALHRKPGLIAPAFDHTFHRHRIIAEKAPEPDLLRMVALGEPAQAYRFAQHHALEQRRPPLLRRRSPNDPKDKSWHISTDDAPCKSERHRKNHTPCAHGIRPSTTESIRRTEMCICPSASQGRIRCSGRPRP
jgi:hypothetical protein